MEQSGIKTFPDIFINFDNDDNLRDGASRVVSLIRSDWPKSAFKFKIFTDGISNKLIGVYPDDAQKNEMILVRVYGAKTELIIDRAAEVRNMQVLSQVGCGCQLYAQFGNGLAYEFLPGDTLTIESAKSDEIYPLVAEAMARMHKLVDFGPSVPKEPCMWKKMRMFLRQYPKDLQDQRLLDNNITFQSMETEVARLQEAIENKCQSPIVFTHNDLLLANIVVNDVTGRVSFIDYEYGDYNYQECDIANHFDEMAGVEEMDFVRQYPDPVFQRKWIKAYLTAFNDKGQPPSEERLESFCRNVDRFSLCYHLMWGLWGLVQASISQIDFDFVAFGLSRLNEYFRVRDERL